MKIAIIAPSPVPFEVGGAENLWWGLYRELSRHFAHEVELLKLPAPQDTIWQLLESYRRFSALDLSYFDLIISTKYPAWIVSHRHHICYLQHKLRAVYDLYPKHASAEKLDEYSRRKLGGLLDFLAQAPSKSLLPAFWQHCDALKTLSARDYHIQNVCALPGLLAKKLIHFLDGIAFGENEIRKFFAISKVVRAREDYFPGGRYVSVLTHPSSLEGLHSGGYNHLFTVSRLEPLKRIDLLIQAYRKVASERRFFIAGTGTEASRLRSLADGDKRIQFLGRVSNSALIEYYANAFFVPFIPFDEDFGLVTIEAHASAKAVLSTQDAGGVVENIEDGKTGRIVAPSIDALAEAMQKLVDDPRKTIEMGKQAAREQSLSWKELLDTLLDEHCN